MSETNRDFSAEATQILYGDPARVAHDRIIALLKSEASIPLIQQNANDNYAASENRLHACEEAK